MESTRDYVKKLHETKAKDEKNQEHQGKGNNSEKLPSKQHSTNK
jgi:hypothetical protein